MGKLPQDASKSPAKDRCQTPAYAVEPLLPYLSALKARLGYPTLMIWESAKGEGLLEGYLRKAGYSVFGTDILDGGDYFTTPNWNAYDVEVTNVPFSRKIEWLERACQRGKPFALLMPSSTRFTVTGQWLVNKYGIEILAPHQRIDFKMPNKGWKDEKGASSAQMHTAWFCKGLSLGAPIVDVPILKGKAREKAIANGTHVSKVD